MAFIFVNCGGRRQVQRVLVADDDTYQFRRFHRDQPISECVAALIEEAKDLKMPPILIDITDLDCGAILRGLADRNYPRLVRTTKGTFSDRGWN